jgi:5-methylthioadenosine/S-adenosylhomocysteine deaminase
MNVQFKNAKILKTRDDHGFEIVDGELWVKGNEIFYIGDGKDAEHTDCQDPIVWENPIDCEGNLLIPGFKNAHTHTPMTFLRSYADDMPLQDWLTKQVFPKEAQLTKEDVYWLDILGVMEYLTSGITSNFDMYLFPVENAKAFRDCGFRSVQTSGINNFSYSVKEVEEHYLAINEMGELNSFILGFHAEYTTSKEIMQGIGELAHKYKSPVFLHNAETKREVAECKERWGMTPTALTDALDLYRFAD